MRVTRRDKKKATAAFASAVVAHDGCLWIDADDVAQSAGSAIASWPSRVGNSPAQGVGAQQPIASKQDRVVRFDGIDDVMTVNLAVNTVEKVTVLWFAQNQATTGAVIELTSAWFTSSGLFAGIDASTSALAGIGGALITDRVSRAGSPIASSRIGCGEALNRTPNPGTIDMIDNNGRVTNAYINQGNTTGSFASGTSYIGSRNGGAPRLAGGICSILVLRELLTVTQMHSLVSQFRRSWRF